MGFFIGVRGFILLVGFFATEAVYSRHIHPCAPKVADLEIIQYPVPVSLAVSDQDKILIPVSSSVYVDPNPSAPTQRLLQVASSFAAEARRVLVVGTGSSPELIMLGRKFPQIQVLHGTDVDPQAVVSSQLAFEANQVNPDRAKVWQSDGFSEVSQNYDLILFAAPRPVRFEDMQNRYGGLSAIRMWPRFSKRKDLFDTEGVLRARLLKDLPRVLSASGKFLIMSDADFEPELPDGFVFKKHGLWDWSPGGRDGSYTIYEIFRKTH